MIPFIYSNILYSNKIPSSRFFIALANSFYHSIIADCVAINSHAILAVAITCQKVKLNLRQHTFSLYFIYFPFYLFFTHSCTSFSKSEWERESARSWEEAKKKIVIASSFVHLHMYKYKSCNKHALN